MNNMNNDFELEIISQQRVPGLISKSITVLRDPDTSVLYMMVSDDHMSNGYIAITPLYNIDGSLRTNVTYKAKDGSKA